MRTARAERMLRTLPSYYDGEPLIERIVQSWANELDRLAALRAKVQAELIPGQATDDLGLLSAWERMLKLPVTPAGVSEADRRQRVVTVLRRQSANSAADAMSVIDSARAGEPFEVLRNTPSVLRDRLSIPYDGAGQSTAELLALVEPIWPAHRQVRTRYDEGFLFGVSRMGIDTW